MITFEQMKEELLSNPEVRKEYEELKPEMAVIRAIMDARNNSHLSQKELSERTGINQSEISKLENGTRNPSIKLLQRLAKGMNMELNISFIPKS